MIKLDKYAAQIIINIIRAHHILYTFIGDYIKWKGENIYSMPTALIHMYNLFEIFSSSYVLTVQDRNKYFSCPKIRQKQPPEFGTHLLYSNIQIQTYL